MCPDVTSEESPPEFERLLDYLKQARGFDFTGYKRSSLRRRIDKRMQGVGLNLYAEYQDHLEVDPDEFGRLFDTILINVTSFFRDPAAWDVIREEIAAIVDGKPRDAPVRMWSAGCASGEEAYSVAMLLFDALGVEQYRERAKIYATDIDEDALAVARLATYPEPAASAIPSDLLDRHTERQGDRFAFRKELRRSVIFGRHDVIQDAPISRIDLLLCRNTLMYFNAETQSRIMSRFHFALNPGGVLFLGKAEMLLSRNSFFSAVDVKHRLFRRVARPGEGERVVVVPNGERDDRPEVLVSHELVVGAGFEVSPVAQIVVDVGGTLVAASEAARTQFRLGPADLGRPFQDLDVSFRPVELRSAIRQAHTEVRPVHLKEVGVTLADGRPSWLDVAVIPIVDRAAAIAGTLITFTDVSRYRELQDELERANRDLEAAYEELQSTNEELETTNEELQSTVEELETTNEELQSTNEELETMNEELQSSNEELQTINDELRDRTAELNAVNAHIESILASLRGGVVLVDRELRVRVWSPQVEELWGLRAHEVTGEHFLDLDIGLPVEQLRRPVRRLLAAEAENDEVVLEATNRRGRDIVCRVALTPLRVDDHVGGVVLLMDVVVP